MTKSPTDERDDRTLVALARAGEGDAAFRALFERYKDELFGFLVRLLRDEPLAEDVLQETFLRVHRSLDAYDPERSLRAWVYQIARNAALDALRLRRKTERILDATRERAAIASEAVLPEVTRREEASRAREALESLPPETRAMLLQRHGLGMKVAELAESWSCTEKTVTARLAKAVLHLAEALVALRDRPEAPRAGDPT